MLLNHKFNCKYLFDFFIQSSLSLFNNKSRFKFSFLLIFLIVVTQSEFNHAQQQSSNNDVYSSVNIGTLVQKLLLLPNKLFIGGQNVFIRMDPKALSIQENFTIGPVEDNYNCPPSPADCPDPNGRTLTQSDCINLFSMNVSSNAVLLACYSTNQGMCYVIPQAGFLAAKLIGDPGNVRNFVASRRSSYVVPVADESIKLVDKRASAIFVAHAYDNRPLDLSPPTISKRKLIAPINLAYWADSKATLSARDVRSPYKQSNWPIDYIYGFKHEDYVFFVKTEPESLKNTQRVTKIIRICIGDGFFGSYSEIRVKCNDQTVATSATLGKMDDYLRNTFNSYRSLTTTNVLFVAFENPKLNKPRSHTHTESRVCAFSVDHLMHEFDNARNACYARRSGKLIETFVEPGTQCIEHENQQCQQSANMFIEVTQTVEGYFLYGDKPKITSMVSLLQGSKLKHTLFIGTENGLVKKIVNGKDIFTVELSKSRIEPDPVIDSYEENIFMATGQSLIKLPVKTCAFYRDCGSCIESQSKDNIDCAWTGKSCVINGPGVTPVSYCEPKLISFSPKKGPTQGGTVIKVKGTDLGFHDETANTENSISVGGRNCAIISWNYTEIVCRIVSTSDQKPKSPSSGVIEIKVKDISSRKGYDIMGMVKSSESFQFVNPSVTSVRPLISPLTGGVNVFIRGTNLDIGSNSEILLAGVKCEPLTIIDSTAIECVSGSAEKQGNPTQGPIGVIIDSASIVTAFNFSYFIDPIFTYISPNVTSATSAVNITVIGDHFDSLYQPRLIVSAIVPKASISPLILASDCTIINVTSFICPSPIMPSEITLESPITTTISFGYGGSTKQIPTEFILVYFPDPKFSEEIVSTTGLDGNRIIEIKGQHLHTGYGMKVLLVNQQDGIQLECKDLKSIDYSLIACNIPLEDFPGDPTISPWNISVVTGTKQLFVGSVPIDPETETESSTIAGIIVGMIAALVIITIIMMYILKRNGYLMRSKKGPPSLGVCYRSPENGPFQRQGSQNDYIQTGSRISGQPLLFNRQSEEIKFVLDPEKQTELIADGTLCSREYLTREKVIGQGNFGLVYQGYLKLPSKQDEKIKVAIKTLKTERGILSQEKGEAFLAEGLIMKEFCHDHVLSLVGVSIDFDGSPMIITPFMEHGDLRSFIQREDLEFTVIQLIQFGVQVAQGMAYLADLKFVHRDLAARNCMVDEHQNIKVADFGLSRDVYTTNYYSDGDNRKPLPRKWMAIESLERGSYDTKSDVWSYGVLLWELLTRGDIPYPDVEDWKMKDYLKAGYRLPRPEHCPPEVYSVMKECWVEDPKSRPNFKEILKLVEVAIESNEKKYLEQKADRHIRYINDPSIFSNPEYDGSMVIKS